MAKIAQLLQRKDGNRKQSAYNEAEEIQKLAYKFFVERGCEHGHDREDWLRAESIIKNRRS